MNAQEHFDDLKETNKKLFFKIWYSIFIDKEDQINKIKRWSIGG